MKTGLAALVVGALLAVSCGGAGTDNPVARAAERSREAKTAKISFTSTMALPRAAGAGEVTARGEGEIDFGGRRGRMTMSFEGMVQGQQMGEVMGEMESIYDGTVLYMRWPLMTQMLPDQIEWIRMDLADIGEEMGVDVGQLMQMGQSDPLQGIEYLQGAEDVEEVGTEEMDGVVTTHYSATIDFKKLADELEGEQADAIRQMVDVIGIEEAQAEAWIGEDDLIRRVRYVYDGFPSLGESAAGGDGGLVMEMDLFDYGAQVNIELPPDDRVTDFARLFNQEQD